MSTRSGFLSSLHLIGRSEDFTVVIADEFSDVATNWKPAGRASGWPSTASRPAASLVDLRDKPLVVPPGV
jgi:hypothetical protein